MPHFWFVSYRISNMSDRHITAQHRVLHKPRICRECLFVLRIGALNAKSQGSAPPCALCNTVLRLTPKPIDV